MRTAPATVLGLVLGLSFAAAAVAGDAPAMVASAPVLLRLAPVSGPVVSLSAADLDRLPRHTLRAAYRMGAQHQMVQAEFSGFSLHDVLHLLGLPEGEALRGEALRIYVEAEGADGYKVVFALAELDPGFTDNSVLIADRRDGKPLDAAEGPLRLVVPAEKRPARWVRQLVKITVHQAN
jgi:DMSO/TMAO reductase YedYZ molybdopterin-dependent catalytic subunit